MALGQIFAGERGLGDAAAGTFAMCELQLIVPARIIFLKSDRAGDMRIAHSSTALLTGHAAPAFNPFGAQNKIKFGADAAAVTGILLLEDTIVGTLPFGHPIYLPAGGFLQLQDDAANADTTFTIAWFE